MIKNAVIGFLVECSKEGKQLWKTMGQVPNCPTCHGTGEPSDKYRNWAEPIWWKGRQVLVCHHCKGAGKV